MPLTKVHMRTIILRNGHLVIDGSESADELREALINLRQHTFMKCSRPNLGTPIDSLIPDVSVLVVKSGKKKNVKITTVDMSDERL